jgi:hypothetical protein
MSGIFSIASHSMLQYPPDVVMQEQIGCAHFSALLGVMSILLAANQPIQESRLNYQPSGSSVSVHKGTLCVVGRFSRRVFADVQEVRLIEQISDAASVILCVSSLSISATRGRKARAGEAKDDLARY